MSRSVTIPKQEFQVKHGTTRSGPNAGRPFSKTRFKVVDEKGVTLEPCECWDDMTEVLSSYMNTGNALTVKDIVENHQYHNLDVQFYKGTQPDPAGVGTPAPVVAAVSGSVSGISMQKLDIDKYHDFIGNSFERIFAKITSIVSDVFPGDASEAVRVACITAAEKLAAQAAISAQYGFLKLDTSAPVTVPLQSNLKLIDQPGHDNLPGESGAFTVWSDRILKAGNGTPLMKDAAQKLMEEIKGDPALEAKERSELFLQVFRSTAS